MAPARFGRSAVAGAATLLCACVAFLALGDANAEAIVTLPTVTLPSLPILGETSVSVPSITVTVPSVTVTTPVVSVTTPSVSASTPSVNLSSSGTGLTSPATPVSEASESPAGGGTSSSPSGGGETTTSRSETPASNGSSDPVAHAASAGAGGSSSTSGTATETTRTRPVSAGTGEHSHPRRQRSAAKAMGRHQGAAAMRVQAGPPGTSVLAPVGGASPRATRASGAGTHHASSPLDAIGRHIPLPLPVPDWSKPIILLLLLVALWFGVRARAAARRARRLEAQRAELLADVDVMQAALVPPVPARVGGLAVSVAYEPADGPAAGGDFYDVFVPSRGKVAIILGDVAGHGHEALAQAALTRYTLRAYLQAGLEPRAALALAGRVLADASLEHFATVAIGVYDARAGHLVYASAGHPPPILHGLQTRQPISNCASPPIGWTVPTGCRQTTVSLPPGSVACFFSDGLIEARCQEGLLGQERVSAMLAELGPRPGAAKLLARVKRAAVSTPDDMAVCIVVPEMTVIPDRHHVEELEADAKALQAGQVRRFLETCQVPAGETAAAIDRAGEIIAVFGTGLLQVELAKGTAAVLDVVPGSAAQAEASKRAQRHAREPSRTI
jgi:serine phosphatase RsbU (regulator of sigma subunit)